jgi:hypothetical protein
MWRASDRLFFKNSRDNSASPGTGSIPAPANPSVPMSAYLTGGSTNTLRNWGCSDYTRVVTASVVTRPGLGRCAGTRHS